jgi:hypothetical protein
MKYLIIESFPSTPHLETSIEIAINLKKKGNDVYFFWVGYDLPWTDWELPLYKKILLFSYEKKIEKAIQYLKSNSITILKNPDLEKNIQKKINLFIKKIKIKDNLKLLKYKKKIPIGLGVYSSLISKYHTINLENLGSIAIKAAKSACLVYERSDKIIKSIMPGIVITFNNRFAISKPIHEAAKLNKVKIFTHERGSTLKKYEIFKGDIFNNNFLEKYIKEYWNKEKNLAKKKKIAKKYFYLIKKKKYFKRVGFNYDEFDKVKFPSINKKKIITYLCTTDYEHQAISNKIDRFYINKKWSNQFETIMSIIKIIKNDFNIFFIIKAHPNFYRSKMLENKLKKIDSENIKYLSSTSNVDSINLIENSDLIFTFGSSLELYSAYCGKKVFSFFKSWWYKFNIVIYPRNNLHLQKIIYSKKEFFDNLERRKNLFKISYYLMTFGEKFKLFTPTGFSRGFFSNKSINHYGPILNFIIKKFNFIKI